MAKKKSSNDPRQKALDVLNAVERGALTLDRVLDDRFEALSGLTQQDRNLFNILVFGVLRRQARLDWIISFFSKTKLKKIDKKILNILRLGLFQIIFLDRVPNSAAVNTAVELSKKNASPWTAGFVNGLLRNAARRHKEVPFPDIQTSPVTAIAIRYSFPDWLIKRWSDRFGIAETEKLCGAVNEIPSFTLRTNSLKCTRDELIKELMPEVKKTAPTPYAQSGVKITSPQKPVSALECFIKGLFQVQDEAAQLVSTILDPQPGESILDACAGLGGKTGHIAQMMNNNGRILAMDKGSVKLDRLNCEMKRLGISIVSTATHDLKIPLSPGRQFDRILIDAPCSATGVIRRNPDSKWTLSEKKIADCSKLQFQLLENLVPLVRTGGILVYAVCSFELEENEGVITKFLSAHPNFSIDKNYSCFKKLNNEGLIDNGGYLKTMPHLHGMDGFFAVRLKKDGD
ncbi:MAG: 16S rRNA (cytosine(967)-C(5))-methyltransferase RsmB [Desulfobacterales bacterium]|nr:16S rRNA (cytosine(967)-C(5))-methyltransferase RsmB [Desulfobacterales bacterium]